MCSTVPAQQDVWEAYEFRGLKIKEEIYIANKYMLTIQRMQVKTMKYHFSSIRLR